MTNDEITYTKEVQEGTMTIMEEITLSGAHASLNNLISARIILDDDPSQVAVNIEPGTAIIDGEQTKLSTRPLAILCPYCNHFIVEHFLKEPDLDDVKNHSMAFIEHLQSKHPEFVAEKENRDSDYLFRMVMHLHKTLQEVTPYLNGAPGMYCLATDTMTETMQRAQEIGYEIEMGEGEARVSSAMNRVIRARIEVCKHITSNNEDDKGIIVKNTAKLSEALIELECAEKDMERFMNTEQGSSE